MNDKTKIALALIVVATIITVVVLLAATRQIHTTGIIAIAGIEIYQEENLQNKLENIDWQTINVGETKYVDCWIKNTGTVPVTLNITTSNYQPPEAQAYLITTWNYANGTVIQPNANVKVNIYLTVSQDARNVTNFSYDITITATEKK